MLHFCRKRTLRPASAIPADAAAHGTAAGMQLTGMERKLNMKEEQLKNLLRELTVEEKVGQLVQWNAAGLVNTGAEITGPETAGVPISRYMGSVLNFGSPAEARTLQEKYLAQDPHHIPLLFMMDVIHGFRTIYPIPLGLGCSFDPALAEECS